MTSVKLDNLASLNNEIFFVGDLNIYAFNKKCPMSNRIFSVAKIFNRPQAVTLVSRHKFGDITTCIDHIYINRADDCSQAVSVHWAAVQCCNY